MIQTETCAVMNGFKNGNSSNSSPGFGSGNSGGGGSDIKYPANCASRFGSSIPGLGFGVSADSSGGGEDSDKMYNPKRNKKIVRIVTVMGYIFSVSTVAILLSLYYLFLWDPYIKGLKAASTTPRPIALTLNASFQLPGDVLSDSRVTTFVNDANNNNNNNNNNDNDVAPNGNADGDVSTYENPFTSYNKAQPKAQSRGHSPTCKKCNSV